MRDFKGKTAIVTGAASGIGLGIAPPADPEPRWGERIGAKGCRPANDETTGSTMHFGYAQPFSFRIGARPEPKVASVRHGVTEITMSDGRLIRATLHVKSVKPNPKQPGSLDISYDVITESMPALPTPILDVHETIP